MLEGELYRGTSGAGAELGHVVIDENGPRCQGNCPNHGCVEALASGTALGHAGLLAAQTHPDSALGRALAADGEITGKTVTEAALAGDGIAVEVVGGIGRHLGVALAGFANTFDPDVIVIGGGVAAAGELLLGPARREVRARALPPMNEVEVALAALGPEAGMIGAARDGARGRRERRARRSRPMSGPTRTEGGARVPGRLTVCPTPIGNLEDLSPRARRALEEADLVACEDTRRAGRLYELLEIRRPRFVSYHDQNEAERARQLVAEIERGSRVVLISDAGTPGDLRSRLSASSAPAWSATRRSRCCRGPRR